MLGWIIVIGIWLISLLVLRFLCIVIMAEFNEEPGWLELFVCICPFMNTMFAASVGIMFIICYLWSKIKKRFRILGGFKQWFWKKRIRKN